MKQRLLDRFSAARERAQRGAVLFLVVLTVLIVMVAGAIAVDLSAAATRGQSLQNAADSAALAGVQAFRQSMGERTEANAADEAAAEAAVLALLEQNGITNLTPQISFTDPENDTEVKVTLYDENAGYLMSGFTGGSIGSVERSATARFERCEDGCLKEVDIPPPFVAVDAFGDGDGYKPIPVNDRLYSINHQSGDGRGNQQITCVRRAPQILPDGSKEWHCWDAPGMLAYPSGYIPTVTPEMPHAAVYGSKIYWASSTSSGHYLFCFETETPAPCSTPYQISTDAHAIDLPKREIHRGGATVMVNDLIYTFTDDHMVHCIVPGDTMTSCGSAQTSLGEAGFPAGDPADGNHGSSMDRVVDETTGRIYSTIHIVSTPGNVDCTASNLESPSGRVVLKNASSNIYIAANGSNDGLVDGVDPADPATQWQVERNGSSYRFVNVASIDAYDSKYLATDFWDFGDELQLVNYSQYGRDFRIEHQGDYSRIRNRWRISGQTHQYLREDGSTDPDTGDTTVEFTGGSYDTLRADWIVRPWECEDPSYAPPTYNGLSYEPGTYVNCFNPTTGLACSGFAPSKIHEDWDSFSGRLFFYRDASGSPIGLCSTGFTQHWDWYTNMSSYTEISCVNHNSGVEDTSLESSMSSFRNALAAHNTATPNPSEGNARWGTWGDPHYNSHTNRMFYPTHRTDSAVLCWDWDNGPCTEGIERVGSSALGQIQDYGFFSEGNCIYGLGHNAIFWAFRADDINEECNGSDKTTSITPCDCGGELFWGTVTFDVTKDQFEEFTIEIRNDDGDRVYPPPGSDSDPIPPHSLLTTGANVDPRYVGDTVDLNHIPATSKTQRLWVTVSVVAKEGVDPWQDGEGSQTFTIEIGRTPRLTD